MNFTPARSTSTRMKCWQAALGAVTTFREAARLLAELAGVGAGSETLRTQAERIGTELEGQARAAMVCVEQTHEPPAGEHDPAPGLLAIKTDGVMVRYRDRHLDGAPVEGDWHEVKVGLAGRLAPGAPGAADLRGGPRASRGLHTPSRHGGGAPRRAGCRQVAPVGWQASRAAAGGGAGRWAKWIWEHLATLFGEARTEIVDWYHASEHIWTVAKAVPWRRHTGDEGVG